MCGNGEEDSVDTDHGSVRFDENQHCCAIGVGIQYAISVFSKGGVQWRENWELLH